MRQILILIGAGVLVACAGGDGERAAKPSSQPNNETVDSVGKNESSKESHIPQARPFLLLLEAVKMRDEHKLKTVHSERIKEGLEKKGWASVMKQYQDAFKEQFGEYKLKEFTFEYEGNEMKGRVAIAHNGNALGKLPVIYENGVWKMNER
jgi:hypothetical protein